MIYTKTGDKGETSLANGQRVAKTDARIEAYGTVDELNSWIGLLRASIQPSAFSLQPSDEQLQWIQNRLFNLGAALSEAPGEWMTEADVHQLEQWIDGMQAEVPPMRAFILPAGGETVCRCHVCRTVCRRAERKMIAAQSSEIELRFINRLSDFLFVLARFVATMNEETETAWKKE
jgi:cob(I)alamin adenosyltransferase